MKNYVKTYLKFFGYDTSSFIPCECCGAKSVDLHHIQSRKRRPDLINDISNLMAVCRNCHQDFGDRNEHLEYLQEIHNEKMKGV